MMVLSYPSHAASLLTGLSAYYKLDETSGTRNDSVGSLHLTATNAPGSTTGIQGNAVRLIYSSAQSLDRASNSAFQPANGDWTLALWFQIHDFAADFGFPFLASKGSNGSTTQEWLVWAYYGDSKINFQCYDSTGIQRNIQSTTVLSIDTWYFLIAEHDATLNQIRMRINNGAPNTLTIPDGGIRTTSADFRIGEGKFDGIVDEVGIWKRLLDSTERTALYNGGSGATYPF